MGDALKFVLVNDILLVHHVEQIVIQVEKVLWADVVQECSFHLESAYDFRIVLVQL